MVIGPIRQESFREMWELTKLQVVFHSHPDEVKRTSFFGARPDLTPVKINKTITVFLDYIIINDSIPFDWLSNV